MIIITTHLKYHPIQPIYNNNESIEIFKNHREV
jgi:hypothetical protein